MRIFLALLLSALTAGAATYYVSPNGNNSSGNSWANAWTSLSSASGVAAGSTVYIDGGTSGGAGITYNISGSWGISGGSAGNITTYQIGQDSSHNGMAIFNGTAGGIWLNGAQYVRISGNAGDGKQHFEVTGYTCLYLGSTVNTVYLGYIYQPNGGSGGSSAGDMYIYPSAVNFELDSCFVKCTSASADSFCYVSCGGSTWDNCLFHNNTIWVPHTSDPAIGADCFQVVGVGYSIYSNTIVGYTLPGGVNHQDGWQDTGGSSYIKIYDNTIIDMGNSGLFADGYNGGFSHVRCYNNIIGWDTVPTGYTRGIEFGTDGGALANPTVWNDVVIANNTIMDLPSPAVFAIQLYNSTVHPSTWTSCYVDNNVSINCAGGIGGSIGANDTGSITVADNVSGASSPDFVGYSTYGGTNNNMRLAPPSNPLIGQGVNLSNYFTTDYAGNTRAASGAWDIGAYAYTTNAPSTTTYYASPTGTGNGSLASPWSLPTALASAGVSNTVTLLDGVYPQSGGLAIPASYMTVKALNKWKAVITNTSLTDYSVALYTWPASTVSSVTIDGLHITHAGGAGIELCGPNCTVQNCWIDHSGVAAAGHQFGHGIFLYGPQNGTLIQNNLIEWNGVDASYDHGIYGCGTNNVIRNNVSRHNCASGIQVYGTGGTDNAQIYNNLVYSNGWGAVFASGDQMYLYSQADGTKNYVFGNTILSTNAYAINVSANGTWYLTNNIIGATSGNGIYGGTVLAGHNYVGTPAFVSPSTGLYWLTSGSAARGIALANVCGPVNFFGSGQSSVSDVGFAPYSATLAADSRTLDPSGTSGADYWFTSKTNTYAPSIASQSAGVTNSTSGGFTVSVTASGTAPLSYQWATNNSPVAGATSSSYGSMPATTNQSGSYSCVITNLYGAITSTAVNVLITNVVVNTNGSLVVNGGFETGDFTGWTFVGSSSDNNVSSAAKDVHSGTYGANLGAVTSLGYLSQTLATTNGQTYLLSLWLNSPDGLTPNEFQVSWNGSVIFDQANIPNIGWTNLQFTVQATGSSTVLQFGFRDDPTAFGFDDISVTATNSAPVITSQPKDQTVRVGTPATFSVTAVGTSLTYDWRWHGTNVGSGSSVSVTPSTTNENGTVVYVNIGSAYGGVVSTNANLYVTNGALPVIVTQPVSKSVTVGNSATFTVSATGATSYQWTMDGTNVATGSSWVTGTGYPVGTNNVQATAINTYGSTLSVIVTFARTNTPTPPTPSTNIYMIHLGQAKLGRAILSQ